MNLLQVLLLTLLMPAASPQLPRPPFVQKWEAYLDDHATVIGVRNGAICLQGEESASAISLDTGTRIWHHSYDARCGGGILCGAAIYTSIRSKTSTIVVSINVASGEHRVVCTLAEAVSSIAASGRRLFVLTGSETLSAVDSANGRTLWSRKLTQLGKHAGSGSRMCTAGSRLYVALASDTEMGVNQATGRVLWSRPARYASTCAATMVGDDVITYWDGIRRTHMATGALAWRDSAEPLAPGTLVGDVLVVQETDALVARNVADGSIEWRMPASIRDDLGSPADNATVTDGECVWLGHAAVVCVSKAGRTLWRDPGAFDGSVAYADSRAVITVRGNRVRCYTPGAVPPAPASDAERQKLAEDLASRYERLSDIEKQRLDTLAPYASKLLLATYVAWAKEFDGERPLQQERATHLCHLLQDARPHLLATFEPNETRDVLAALNELGPANGWRGALLDLLRARGDQAVYAPILVTAIKAQPDRSQEAGLLLRTLVGSSHPQAVALMLQVLRDPNANPDWRSAAYKSLAATGGTAGAAAVLAARPNCRRVKPWYDRIDVTKLGRDDRVDERCDAKGRTWLLFHSAILGNESDLFIVQKLRSGWGRPLFSGVWTRGAHYQEPSGTFRGIPVERLIPEKWLRVLPDAREITRDRDADGLTDLVEERLGTDPQKPDTDGDGVPDAVDPCPAVSPRRLGDDENVLDACVGAYYFECDLHGPIVLSGDLIRPFKLHSYPGTVIWDTGGAASHLAKVLGGGVEFVSISSPDDRTMNAPAVWYGPGHRTARTRISTSFGPRSAAGFDVRLRKIGDEWFVVDMEMAWIS